MKNVKFLQLLTEGTDIISVVNSGDDIEGGSMEKLVDNSSVKESRDQLINGAFN